jgi:hypothetical protein
MVSLKTSIIFAILLIIGLLIAVLTINKVTIDNYSNKMELYVNINNLRGIVWANYVLVTIITLYLMVKLYGKAGIKNNVSIFVLNVMILLLNTGLTSYEETVLTNTKTQDKDHELNYIYLVSAILSVVNIANIITLLYHLDNYTSLNMPSIQYTYTEQTGWIHPFGKESTSGQMPTSGYDRILRDRNQLLIDRNQLKQNIRQRMSPAEAPLALKPTVIDTSQPYINPMLNRNIFQNSRTPTPPRIRSSLQSPPNVFQDTLEVPPVLKPTVIDTSHPYINPTLFNNGNRNENIFQNSRTPTPPPKVNRPLPMKQSRYNLRSSKSGIRKTYKF